MLGNALAPTAFDSTISFDGTSQALTSHLTEEQYGMRLGPWLDDKAPTAEQLWAFVLTGDESANYIPYLPSLQLSKSEQGDLSVKGQIYRYALADDVEIQLQYSNDLLEWHAVTEFEITNQGEYKPGVFLLEVTIPCPPDAPSPHFYRARVIHHHLGG